MRTAIVVVQAFLLSSCRCLMVAPSGPDEEANSSDVRRVSHGSSVVSSHLREVLASELTRMRDILRDFMADDGDEGAERLQESEVEDDPKSDIHDDPKSDIHADGEQQEINRPWTHNLATWNAQGRIPTAEFLGGSWMTQSNGFYNDMEILTGVMMFRIAGCDVDFTQPAFKQYEKRYAAMYERYITYEKVHRYEKRQEWDEDLSEITFANLLFSLPKALESFWHKPPGSVQLPTWVHGCSVKEVIRNRLGLCADEKSEAGAGEGEAPNVDAGANETEKEAWACPFTLRSEGCWRRRSTLPVYGKKFSMLLHSFRAQPVFWAHYVHDLAAQVHWGEECDVGEHVVAGSTPGSHIKFPKEDSPSQLKLTEWSMTAAWDALLMKLTTIASKLLVKMNVQKQELVNKVPPAVFMTDDQVKTTRDTLIVAGLFATFQSPDVAFLQRAGPVDFSKLCAMAQCPGVRWRQHSTDTAIYVKEGFGGGIDEEDSQYAEAVWDHMVQTLHRAGCGKSDDETNSSEPCKNFHLPPGQFESLTPGQQKNIGDDGPLLDLNRVTIVVTKSNPKLLLLSIHSDQAGFFANTFLGFAKSLYDAMAKEHCLSALYVGMSANLQAVAGSMDFNEKWGLSYDQFQRHVPEGMHMFAPPQRTISKVRTFLQPQYDMIAKEEREVSDVLFVYPVGTAGTFRAPTVYNTIMGGILRREGDETANYPTDGWPMDHFLVSGVVDSLEKVRMQPGSLGDEAGKQFTTELGVELAS